MPTSGLVGLLVVHGIGEQKPLVTAGKVARGLKAAMPELQMGEPDPETCTITIECPDPSVLVRLYEVHWSTLFPEQEARGAFAPEKVQSTAWFPWLNLRSHLYPRPRRLAVVLWTAFLVPVSGLLYLGLMGARLPAVIIERQRGDRKPAAEPAPKPSEPVPAGSWWTRLRDTARATAEEGRGGEYSELDRSLDLVAGDVFTYVAQSIPWDPAQTNADRVRRSFYEQAARAHRDGCEEIHVLAHSLGTVVAFNALTGYRLETADALADDSPLRIGRLWTIGSPLQKFAFFWPAIVSGDAIGSFRLEPERVCRTSVTDDHPQWVNFKNPLDLVAGRLRSFPGWDPVHQRVWAGGTARSHTIYERNAKVMASLTEGLFGLERVPTTSRRRTFLGAVAAVGESVAVLFVLLAVIMIGAGLVAVVFALFPWLLGTIAGFVVSDQTAASIKDWGYFIVGVLMLGTVFVLAPRIAASDEHRKWRPPDPDDAQAEAGKSHRL